MKSIVTGGAGFIGSHLVDNLLNLNHEVVVIDNCSTGRRENLSHCIDKIKFIDADISIEGDWQNSFKNVDYVFHLAALADIVPSINNPHAYFRSNVIGTFNIAQSARKYGVKKIIYAASSSCYGIPKQFPTPETSEIKPQYPYALTKRLGEETLLHWSETYDIDTISLRFFNVYGTRSRTSGTYGAVMGVFLAQKLANHPCTVVGDGNQTRDFTYVSDVVDAIITCAFSPIKKEIFNIGSGKTISINRIVELLDCAKIHIPKRPGEPESTFADISKIQASTGWKPKISIEEGIKKILDDIDYWKFAPVWTPEKIQAATEDWFKYLSK